VKRLLRFNQIPAPSPDLLALARKDRRGHMHVVAMHCPCIGARNRQIAAIGGE
jgi:hypothetical protein